MIRRIEIIIITSKIQERIKFKLLLINNLQTRQKTNNL